MGAGLEEPAVKHGRGGCGGGGDYVRVGYGLLGGMDGDYLCIEPARELFAHGSGKGLRLLKGAAVDLGKLYIPYGENRLKLALRLTSRSEEGENPAVPSGEKVCSRAGHSACAHPRQVCAVHHRAYRAGGVVHQNHGGGDAGKAPLWVVRIY